MQLPKPVHRPAPDAHTPRLRIRTARQEPGGGGCCVVSHLELARLDVNRYDPPVVASFHLRPHALLVKRLAAVGELLFTVTRLSCGHVVPPITIPQPHRATRR